MHQLRTKQLPHYPDGKWYVVVHSIDHQIWSPDSTHLAYIFGYNLVSSDLFTEWFIVLGVVNMD